MLDFYGWNQHNEGYNRKMHTRDKEDDRMKTGLVLEGGALRGLFTAGALDYLLDKQVTFDYIAGVSAGAGNMMNFVLLPLRSPSEERSWQQEPMPIYGMWSWN